MKAHFKSGKELKPSNRRIVKRTQPPPGREKFRPREWAVVQKHRTPQSVQDYLNHLPYNREKKGETLRSFRGVVAHGEPAVARERDGDAEVKDGSAPPRPPIPDPQPLGRGQSWYHVRGGRPCAPLARDWPPVPSPCVDPVLKTPSKLLTPNTLGCILTGPVRLSLLNR